MNLALNMKFEKINDLCDQVFDYLHLTYYALESKIDNELNINSIKSKFANIHIKVDTGLSRMGILPEQLDTLLNEISKLKIGDIFKKI